MYKISESQYCKHWTDLSRFCYQRGCNCEGCYIKDCLETHCFMKTAVFELVRKFGAPPERKFDIREQKVIEAILNGAETKLDIIKDTGLTTGVVQLTLNELYIQAEQNGMFFRDKVKFYDYIKWVRGEYEQ